MATHRVRFLTFVLMAGLPVLAGRAAAQEERTSGLLLLDVPQEQAARGTVYHVVAAKAPHITFRSNAKNEKFKGTSGRLIGYVVVPEEGERAKLAAGRFQLPAMTLDTGNPTMNEHMQAERWLHCATYPHIAFTIREVTDIKPARESEESSIYRAKLTGTMSLVGHDNEMTVNATLTFKPESETTRRIAPGDLMTIRSTFDVVLNEFGMGINDKAIADGKIAGKIRIDVNLTLSTKAPGEAEE